MGKKAFDFSRSNLFTANPNELCIIGGATMANADERGPLDTDHKSLAEHPLWDVRIHDALDEGEIANTDAFGVIEPVIITKMDINGVATPVVVAGRRRVRRARVVNARRAKAGLALMSVEFKTSVHKGEAGLMGVMISENEVRKGDSVMVKVDKLKAYLGRGVSVGDAAVAFGLNETYVKQLLTFDDRASAAVKAAAAAGPEAGGLSVSAACEIARLDDHAAQDAALADTLASVGGGGGKRKATVREAVAAVSRQKDAGATIGGKAATAKPGKPDAKPAATGAKPATATQGGLVPTRRELNGLLRELSERTEVEAETEAALIDARNGDALSLPLDGSHLEASWLIGVRAGIALALGKCDDKELLKLLAKAAQA